MDNQNAFKGQTVASALDEIPPVPYAEFRPEELIARDEGIARYNNKALGKSITSPDLPVGQLALQRAVQPYRSLLDSYITDAMEGKSGRAQDKAKWLIYPTLSFGKRYHAESGTYYGKMDTLAFIVLKQLLTVTHTSTLSSLSFTIATAIEQEHRIEATMQVLTKAHRKNATDRLAKKNGQDKASYMKFLTEGKNVGLGWSLTEKGGLGMLLIELACRATGFWTIDMVKEYNFGKPKTVTYLNPTPALIHWMLGAHRQCALASPVYPILHTSPEPWTHYTKGAYDMLHVPLIKGGHTEYLEDAHNTGALDAVYKSVNYIQEVEWGINSQVLDVIRYMLKYDITYDIPTVPLQRELPLPQKLPKAYKETHPEEWAKYATEMGIAQGHNNDLDRLNRIREVQIITQIAEQAEGKPCYYPHNLDFRGRIYPMPLFLNPQGDDMCRGLLEFGYGKAITSETSTWLAIHGANAWANDGVDKEDYATRYNWTISHSDEIVACARDPHVNLMWTQADGGKKAFQFLAFCFEWAGWIEEGDGYISSLPIGADGTCNGLQHYSALTRSKEEGALVNLIPGDKPADIYRTVADLVNPHISNDADAKKEGWELAQWWVDSKKVNRKLTKRSVMTTPYGVTRYGVQDQLLTDFKDWFKEQGLDGKKRNELITYIAGVIWDYKAKVMPGATKAMQYLRDMAKQASEQGVPLQWRLPDGFVVQQRYKQVSVTLIRTKIWGGTQTRQISANTELPTINVAKQINGAGPNYIHSLDACHLRMTMLGLQEQGIKTFGAIHDSYATHAADYELMQQVIREKFVELHRIDLLSNLRANMQELVEEELPQPPAKGELDIEQVLESDYFFG